MTGNDAHDRDGGRGGHGEQAEGETLADRGWMNRSPLLSREIPRQWSGCWLLSVHW